MLLWLADDAGGTGVGGRSNTATARREENLVTGIIRTGTPQSRSKAKEALSPSAGTVYSLASDGRFCQVWHVSVDDRLR